MHPKTPIEGIPNIKIKPANQLSHNIPSDIKKNYRIHSNVTIHDTIVNTYLFQLNTQKDSNREALINKLRDHFIDVYQIETIVNFVSGHHMYVLMIDLLDTTIPSPTLPTLGRQSATRLND